MQQDHTIPYTQPGPTPDNQPNDSPQNPRVKGKSSIRNFIENFGVIIAAPLIAILLVNFVFQSYEVDGPSMEATLYDQDRLVVLKLGRTVASIKGDDYIPKRGSIIIFHRPDAQEFGGGDRQLVKRVVALPGERVVVRSGQVTVYNSEHPKGFNPDEDTDYSDLVDASTPGNIDITVKSGELFVLGDNRDNSSDSRAFGTISSDSIVGELALRIYPFNSFKVF